MKGISLHDDAALSRLTRIQKEKGWDLEKSFDWNASINLSKLLVPLDQKALFFPGASLDERLAISQAMGLTIAASICEMEDCLLKFKPFAWDELVRKREFNRGFEQLGENFFVEEEKHTASFHRYLEKFAKETGVDPEDLKAILPKVGGTKTEWIFKKNLETGGNAFWWTVAEVEQEFLLLYRSIKPFREKIDPLYFELHEKHFEEEVRHAPFPYLMIEWLVSQRKGAVGIIHQKTDLMASQLIKALWTGASLHRLTMLKKLAGKHEFFATLAGALTKLSDRPPQEALEAMRGLVTTTPYISALINSRFHPRTQRFADEMGALSIPFPDPTPAALVGT